MELVEFTRLKQVMIWPVEGGLNTGKVLLVGCMGRQSPKPHNSFFASVFLAPSPQTLLKFLEKFSRMTAARAQACY